jgi:nitroreductase
MNKPATNQHPIHDLLKNRWSPRAFSAQPVGKELLLSMFEAARWAPSGGNGQPWSFIVTTLADPEPHAKLVAALGERNQMWAKHAPVLVLSIVQREREPGKPNPWATYDLGQSVAHLSIQATALGLRVHQMAGFDQQKAREAFDLPQGYDPVTVFAVGYPAELDSLPVEIRERELAPRTRKALSDFVFDGAWNVALDRERNNAAGE